MAEEEAAPDLTLDNVLLQLTKHGFPANKWGELAIHLHQEDINDPSPQLADVIERWLASNDENKSWRGLVDAVVRCKEMNVAKPLAHEVKVPFPGAHRQWTPSKPTSQSTSSDHDDSLSATQLRESHSAGNNTQQQQQQQSSDPPPSSSGGGSSSSGSSVIRRRRPQAVPCKGAMINPLLALASASAYYFIGDQKRCSTIGHVLFGVFGYTVLAAMSHKLGVKPVDVRGVKCLLDLLLCLVVLVWAVSTLTFVVEHNTLCYCMIEMIGSEIVEL